MSDLKDFVIENGVLTKYVGPGGDVVIPEGVTKIGWSAFAGNDQVQSVVIANTVTVIGELAFAKCATLSSVRIPESVQEIERRAFDGCAMLGAVFGLEGVLLIGEYAFRKCVSLKRVTIPKSVKTICGEAFSSCTALNEIVFESDTVELEYKVFKNCDAVRTVRIPTENEEKRSRMWTALSTETQMRFALCFSLIKNGVPLRYEEMQFIKASYRKSIEKLIKNGDAEWLALLLEQKANSINWINGLLTQCHGDAELTTVLLNYKKKHFSEEELEREEILNEEKELGLAERSLSEWREIFKIVFFEGTACIKGYLLRNAQVVTPPKVWTREVDSIGYEAFQFNSDIETVIVPSGIRIIGKQAFYGCSSLRDIFLPETIDEICQRAFEYCPNVTIHAPAGSYAEQYAKENTIPFVAE